MDVQQLYKKRFESKENLKKKNQIWRILCRHFFQKFIPENSTVIDIASGYCEFINNIRAKEKFAFDINVDTKLYADNDVQVIEDSFFNMDVQLQAKKADIIFASNIFEHLESKEQLVLAIQKCRNNMHGNGGKLMILQPDIRYTGAAYWDFIDHKIALTGQALIEAGEMCGLKLKYRIRKFLPYTTKSKLPQRPWLIWLYLKLMPVSGFFMGQQTFLILEICDD